MGETIDISGIDKAELVAGLYNGTMALGMGVLHDIGEMSIEQARIVVERKEGRLYFDYLFGRPLKCDVSGDTAEVGLYDRDAGPGAFARVVEGLRAKK